MSKITVPLPKGEFENLNEAPHVLPQLIDMMLGAQEFPSAQREQMWGHVAECVYCQTFLATYLLKSIEYNKAHGESEEPARKLLIQLTRLMHTSLQEHIPAYVEALEALGDEEANKRFPLLAEHIGSCQDCLLEVRDLRLWLSQSGL